jgi:hypothetical protein
LRTSRIIRTSPDSMIWPGERPSKILRERLSQVRA